MESSRSYFNVSDCPLCCQAHKYPIRIIRSSYLYGTPQQDSPKEYWTERKLFTCPTTGKKFEGDITLRDDPEDRIMAVKVEESVEE
jgi:hypothetical protein